MDFRLIVHKFAFMADEKDPLVLSNYIFQLLEVNLGVARFLIELHPDDVDDDEVLVQPMLSVALDLLGLRQGQLVVGRATLGQGNLHPGPWRPLARPKSGKHPSRGPHIKGLEGGAGLPPWPPSRAWVRAWGPYP